MPGLLANRTVLLAKIEATYATDPTPAVSANEVEIFSLSIKAGSEKIERKPLRASLSSLASSRSKMVWDISFETELKNGGTAGTIGRLSPLFRSCGMTETVSPGTSVVYNPGTPSGSCTLWIYKDGHLYKATGCRGSFEIVAEAGKIPMVKWTYKGIYQIPTDVAMVSPTYESTIGVPSESVAMAVSGFVGVTKDYSLNINNQIVERPSINSVNAMLGVIIGSRSPTGKLKLEAELEATEPMWSEWQSDTAVNFTASHGSAAGNIATITATSKTQYDSIDPTDENGIYMYDISLGFFGTDNEFTITLT